MAYNKRYKKSSYKSNSYGYNQPTGSYAYHDIDEHHDWIKYMMDVHGLSNYRYISVSDDVKEGEIVAPGYADGTKLMVVRYPIESYRQIQSAFVVNNKENIISDFGCVINGSMAKKLGCDFNFDIVNLQEVE